MNNKLMNNNKVFISGEVVSVGELIYWDNYYINNLGTQILKG